LPSASVTETVLPPEGLVPEGPGAAEVVDLVLLEEELDASGELVGNIAGTPDDLRPVVAEVVEAEAELGGLVAHGQIHVGVLDERLRGNAAPVETGPAGAVVLDAGDFLAELGGADGADIAGGSAADDDKVVGGHGGIR
jgi:hypothetical protein